MDLLHSEGETRSGAGKFSQEESSFEFHRCMGLVEGFFPFFFFLAVRL